MSGLSMFSVLQIAMLACLLLLSSRLLLLVFQGSTALRQSEQARKLQTRSIFGSSREAKLEELFSREVELHKKFSEFGEVAARLGRHEEAIQHFEVAEKFFETSRATHGSKNHKTEVELVRIKRLISEQLIKMGEFRRAEERLDIKPLENLTFQSSQDDLTEDILARTVLIDAIASQKREIEAESYFIEYMYRLEVLGVTGPHYPAIGVILAHFGEIIAKQSRHSEAARIFEKALSFLDTVTGRETFLDEVERAERGFDLVARSLNDQVQNPGMTNMISRLGVSRSTNRR